MKLSNKLFLPVLALSLVAGTAFAIKQPKPIEPSLGNLLALSACNAIAGIASFVALEILIPAHHSMLKPLSQICATGYWINEEVKAIEEYKIKMYQWKAQQIINEITK